MGIRFQNICFLVSAEHRLGFEDLLDHVMEGLVMEPQACGEEKVRGRMRVLSQSRGG